ncbi:FAD-dependent oxidoreductase [Streptomyces sp. NBC_00564]|uniref:FAD-dependent oxidoreductase n=1 Tax=Streptomyces sp. NBC_00564 TaxID=2903663 RepID=UPI00352EB919|nr:FAD-binding oxidoreductase [Streptomyces sp. NBC_00564]
MSSALDPHIPEPETFSPALRDNGPAAKVAIVGAGWYGCHIAEELRADGHDVHIFESQADIFGGASGHTQNRLHLGYHYARSAMTRRQASEGYRHFKKIYPTLSRVVANNIYAVPRDDSLLDSETYLQVMQASQLPIELVDSTAFGLAPSTTAFRVAEELLCTQSAKRLFGASLRPQLRLGTRAESVEEAHGTLRVNGEPFDAAVDCTWGAWEAGGQGMWPDLYFEPCVTFVYESQLHEFALTLVDGAFFSVYPFQDGLHTLTSVTHTPLGRCRSHDEARQTIARQNTDSLERTRRIMEKDVARYWPPFLDHFRHVDAFFSVKTKMRSASDARVVSVRRSGSRISVFAGKVNTIFTAADLVRQEMHAAVGRNQWASL